MRQACGRLLLSVSEPGVQGHAGQARLAETRGLDFDGDFCGDHCAISATRGPHAGPGPKRLA
jgi:hypothetical protein